jgi:hypothetical protein
MRPIGTEHRFKGSAELKTPHLLQRNIPENKSSRFFLSLFLFLCRSFLFLHRFLFFFSFFLIHFSHSVQRVIPISPKSNFGMATVYIYLHLFEGITCRKMNKKYRSQCVPLYVDFNLIQNRCNNFTSRSQVNVNSLIQAVNCIAIICSKLPVLCV